MSASGHSTGFVIKTIDRWWICLEGNVCWHIWSVSFRVDVQAKWTMIATGTVPWRSWNIATKTRGQFGLCILAMPDVRFYCLFADVMAIRVCCIKLHGNNKIRCITRGITFRFDGFCMFRFGSALIFVLLKSIFVARNFFWLELQSLRSLLSVRVCQKLTVICWPVLLWVSSVWDEFWSWNRLWGAQLSSIVPCLAQMSLFKIRLTYSSSDEPSLAQMGPV